MGQRFKRLAHDMGMQAVKLLLHYAREAVKRGEIELARRYVDMAWEVVKRLDFRTPRVLRRWVCERCGVPLIPGVTARFRLEPRGRRGSRLSVTCLICGWVKRYHYGVVKAEAEPEKAEGDSSAGSSRRHNRQERID